MCICTYYVVEMVLNPSHVALWEGYYYYLPLKEEKSETQGCSASKGQSQGSNPEIMHSTRTYYRRERAASPELEDSGTLLRGCVWAANTHEDEEMGLPCVTEKPLVQTGTVSGEDQQGQGQSRVSSHLFCWGVPSTSPGACSSLASSKKWREAAAWPDVAVATVAGEQAVQSIEQEWAKGLKQGFTEPQRKVKARWQQKSLG